MKLPKPDSIMEFNGMNDPARDTYYTSTLASLMREPQTCGNVISKSFFGMHVCNVDILTHPQS